jgi:hypothetical protein
LTHGEAPYINTINPNFTFDVYIDLDPEIFNKISNYDRVKVDYKESW